MVFGIPGHHDPLYFFGFSGAKSNCQRSTFQSGCSTRSWGAHLSGHVCGNTFRVYRPMNRFLYVYIYRTVWLYLGVLHLGSGCPKMPRRMQVVFCSAMQVGRKIYPPNTWHAVSLKNHLTNIEKTHEYKLISKQMHL